MKAIQIHQFGDSDVLKYVEIPQPQITADQLLVRVVSAGVNPIDYKTRKGLGFVASYLRDKLPWTPGFDFAGEVVATGNQVKHFAIGDAVVGFANFPQGGGAYAECLAVTESQVVKKPRGVSYAAAGALPVAGLTAYQALFNAGQLQPAQSVLILAGAGGVGHLAVQLAKASGCYVAATASAEKLSFLRSLGADLPCDYRNADALKQNKFDLIIDNMGGQIGIDALDYLNANGRLVTIPTVTAADIITSANNQNKTAVGMTVKFDSGQLENLLHRLAETSLRLHIDKTYLLREAGLAHQEIEQGHTTGKRVLIID